MISCSTNRLSAVSGATLWVTLWSVSSKHEINSKVPVILSEARTSAKTERRATPSLCAVAVVLGDIRQYRSMRDFRTVPYFSTRGRFDAGCVVSSPLGCRATSRRRMRGTSDSTAVNVFLHVSAYMKSEQDPLDAEWKGCLPTNHPR